MLEVEEVCAVGCTELLSMLSVTEEVIKVTRGGTTMGEVVDGVELRGRKR